MRRIFLSGGGGKIDSAQLDQFFSSILNKKKPLIYIPNAMKSKPYDICLKWFKSVFSPLGIEKIEMWADLIRDRQNVALIAGLYIGGGDTAKLLTEIQAANFGNYLLKAIGKGIPVYGGSAGAIILGKDTRTAPEVKMKAVIGKQTEGINVLFGHSVFCHYEPRKKDEVADIAKTLQQPMIVLSEKSGASISGLKLMSWGKEPVIIVRGQEWIFLKSGEKYSLK